MKIGNTIYLDHQATTPIDPHVLAEMVPYFSDSFGNPHSSEHCIGWEAARAVEHAAERIAQLISADADEIIFTSGATESNNIALLGLVRRAAGGERRRILLSAIEHKSVLAVSRILGRQYGFSVEQIPVDRDGFIELHALRDMLDEDVLAVSVIAVNNEIGTIQDVRQIAGLAESYGAVFHCDAAQAPVAAFPDGIFPRGAILSLSAHKMYGPKGIGVVAIPREIQEKIEPLIYGGGQQNGLRSGTVPVPLCVGMGLAAQLLTTDDAEERRVALRRHRDAFLDGLKSLSWPISVNGPIGRARHPGNLNVRFAGFAAQEILSALQPRIAASTGSACTSGFPEPSHVLRAIGLDSYEAESSIRFSLGFGTTDQDVDNALGMIDEALKRLSTLGQVSSA
ncbi:MAG: cysteine desulfurase [Gammaproteobacteria bacterium]|nr:cysteine desulfurase [Gammaproteobacteria bacterium]